MVSWSLAAESVNGGVPTIPLASPAATLLGVAPAE